LTRHADDYYSSPSRWDSALSACCVPRCCRYRTHALMHQRCVEPTYRMLQPSRRACRMEAGMGCRAASRDWFDPDHAIMAATGTKCKTSHFLDAACIALRVIQLDSLNSWHTQHAWGLQNVLHAGICKSCALVVAGDSARCGHTCARMCHCRAFTTGMLWQ
jgi:hypothetical protein